ncbi:uncharacterized protein LOC130053648 [Ostrea edulis]|uniref:uncharacterized protein LOC130053648 n=1 Tax=Ostrea edulis TaxID=37623 RepID=UPI0024AF5A60|nr:uncharacterized protein LOC130053648 [Ostrea edulis]
MSVLLQRNKSIHVQSIYISSWFPIEAQVSSPVVIPHPIGQIPAKVEVQVKVQEGGNDVIFPASGSAQRDDDSDNVYGGVVYLYNELHVKVFVPYRDENSYKGVMIYTGGTAFAGPFQANYVRGFVRIKVWGLCDLPPANFTISGSHSISRADNHKSITHGLGRYPDFVVVQLKLSNGYISEAGGVTFNSISETYQSICGTVFAYNDQEIRLWTLSAPTGIASRLSKSSNSGHL